MSRAVYDVGDGVRLEVVFRDLLGQYADPSTVTCRVKNLQDGTLLTPTPVQDAIGHYHADITWPSHGAWVIRWAGSGTVAAVDQTEVTVERDLTA